MFRKLLPILFTLLLIPKFCLAGGLEIIDDTITLNGINNDIILKPNTRTSIRYLARDYSYSGRTGDMGFHVLTWIPITSESKKMSTKERVDTKKGAIRPFVVEARSYPTIGTRSFDYERSNFGYSGEFMSPEVPGEYDLCYSRATLFISDIKKSPSAFGIFSERDLLRHLKRHSIECAAKFHVSDAFRDYGQDVSVYMKVNDKLPHEATINPGVSENPIRFSWYTKGAIPAEALEYQFRLYPEEDWSPQTKSTEVQYYYFSEGQHEFQVKAIYSDHFGNMKETPMAKLAFPLRQAFVAQPKKASGGRTNSPIAPIPRPTEMYSRSRALIVGITKFSDSHFSPLPFVEEDVRLIDEALTNQGFINDIVVGVHTKQDISQKLGDFLNTLMPNDRVIIYFSTHGFQHPSLRNRAYLATTDCSLERPDDTCISLSSIEDRLSVPLALPIKHSLIVLDACAAGLGVLTKGFTYSEVRLVNEKGAHMITAGMADELAQGNVINGSSYFTGYFVEGLNGAADYTKDGFVTLTELLLFTRYNVARSTNGAQTPMLGRILGPGEMVFESKGTTQ